MLWARRALAWPGCELLFVGSLRFVALLFAHSNDLRQHWSSLHWEDQLFFDHDGYFSHAGLPNATAAAVALGIAQVKLFWRHHIKDYATVASA